MKWIHIKEKLPKHGQRILLRIDQNGHIDLGRMVNMLVTYKSTVHEYMEEKICIHVYGNPEDKFYKPFIINSDQFDFEKVQWVPFSDYEAMEYVHHKKDDE